MAAVDSVVPMELNSMIYLAYQIEFIVKRLLLYTPFILKASCSTYLSIDRTATF